MYAQKLCFRVNMPMCNDQKIHIAEEMNQSRESCLCWMMYTLSFVPLPGKKNGEDKLISPHIRKLLLPKMVKK